MLLRQPAVPRILLATACIVSVTGHASPLFDDDTLLQIELRGPLDTLIAGKSARGEHEFELELHPGAETALVVRVRPRGNSRLRVCSFPPLRLDFTESRTGDTVFAGQGRLKLVTHCTRRRKDSNNVFEEYLAYRIFNAISDASYRVRLARLSYVNTDETGGHSQEQFGFFIESEAEFVERTGMHPVRVPGVVYSRLNKEQAARVFVFHYLIGNTDWSLVTALSEEFCCHNGDLFETHGEYYLVPYDFDLAGVVDASYARPDASLQIRSVKSRVYRGYCASREELRSALRRVRASASVLRRLVNSMPADPARNSEGLRYLETFLPATANEDRVLDTFEKRCL